MGGDLRFAVGLAVASALGAAVNRMMDHVLNQEVVETLAMHYAVSPSEEPATEDDESELSR